VRDTDRLAILGGSPVIEKPLPTYTPVTEDEIEAVTRTLRYAPLTTLFGGFEIEQFEKEFAQRFGSPHAIAVTSGTTALHAALVTAGIKAGDEVIVTPYSFIASVSVVVQSGAKPIFADIDPETFVLDPKDVRRKVTARTRAILPVHICGYPVDIEQLLQIAVQHSLAIIEDCAAAHGATVNGRCIGTFGDFGCFSFNIRKIIRTGEGGMVLTAKSEWAERLREIRVNGLSPTRGINSVNSFGFNYTMAQPLAALGRRQLVRFDEMSAIRQTHGKALREGMQGLPVSTPPDIPGRNRAYHCVPFLLTRELTELRDQIVAALRRENVPAEINCRRPLYHIEYLRQIAPDAYCPVADDICRRTFVIDPLPCYSSMEIEQIVLALRKVLSNTHKLKK
jgi:dTDP-4-amino-4,6-dideoxygalactose transaminase